jgi:phage gp16-like protein
MNPSNRRRLIGKLHIAKTQLAMADTSYRAMLQRITGQASSSLCSEGQLVELLAECKRLGFVARTRADTGRKPVAAADDPRRISDGQIRKIEALLSAKASQQGATVPWAYADALAQRLCKVERVQWLNAMQAGKVIAALQYDVRRHIAAQAAADPLMGAERRARIDALCAQIHDALGRPACGIVADPVCWNAIGEEDDKTATPAEADKIIAALEAWLAEVIARNTGTGQTA